MNKFSPRERQMLALAVLLGALAALQLGVVRPVLRTIRRLSTRAKVSAQDLERMRTVAAREQAVENAYESIRSRITSTKRPESEIIDMLLTVEKAARDAGVEILDNQHIKDSPAEYFNLHTVRFRGQADAGRLLAMIYALQNPQLLLKIPEIEFEMTEYKLEMQLSVTRVIYVAGNHE